MPLEGGVLFLRYEYEIDPLMEPNDSKNESLQHPGKISAKPYLHRTKEVQDFAQAETVSAQQRYEFNSN